MSETIELADGTVINVDDGKVVKNDLTFDIPTMMDAQEIVITTKRKLADLPAVPKTMNTIGVVLTYVLFGLDSYEIAQATGLSEDQINRIKEKDEFSQMRETISQQVLNSQTSAVRQMFEKYSVEAAKHQLHLMKNSEMDMVQHSAAKDILDRAGHRPADIVVEQRNRSMSELTIRIVEDNDKDNDAGMIELNPIIDNDS